MPNDRSAGCWSLAAWSSYGLLSGDLGLVDVYKLPRTYGLLRFARSYSTAGEITNFPSSSWGSGDFSIGGGPSPRAFKNSSSRRASGSKSMIWLNQLGYFEIGTTLFHGPQTCETIGGTYWLSSSLNDELELVLDPSLLDSLSSYSALEWFSESNKSLIVTCLQIWQKKQVVTFSDGVNTVSQMSLDLH